MVGDVSLRTIDLDDAAAGIRTDGLAETQFEVPRVNVGFFQRVVIFQNTDQSKKVVVAREEFDKNGFITVFDAVAADPRFLHVSSCDLQCVSDPASGREALPRVECVFVRSCPPIHPDGPETVEGLVQKVPRDHVLTLRFHLLRDPQVGMHRSVVGRMRPALVLGNGQQGRAPTLSTLLPGRVDGKPREVPDHGSARTFRLVLVHPVGPFTCQVDLGEGGCGQYQPDENQQRC